MKKLILAALAASVVATPVMAAPYQGHDNRGRIEQRHDNRGNEQRHDNRGNEQRHDNRGNEQRHDNRGYDQRHDNRGYGQRHDNRGWQMRSRGWHRGERFDYRQARNYRVIGNPRAYRLHDAPRGYRWVQSGNDAVLIGITSGIVASVIANMVR